MFDDLQNNQFIDESVQMEPESAQEAPRQLAEDPKDRNFRILREQKERAERERDELAKSFKEMQSKQQPQQEDDDFPLSPDEYVEGKHLSKYHKELRSIKEQLKNYQHQASISAIENKLQSEYPDFQKVVSIDNIQTLKSLYPHIANTLEASNDIYNKAVTAYTLIKQFGIGQVDEYAADRERAQRNASKPRALNTVSAHQGDTPLSKANAFAGGLSDQLKDQLRKEMIEAMKNR